LEKPIFIFEFYRALKKMRILSNLTLLPDAHPPFMQLPKLTPGKRHALARPPGSADALLLAQLAQLAQRGQGLIAVFTADASDARGVCKTNWPFSRPSCARFFSPTGKRCLKTLSRRTRTSLVAPAKFTQARQPPPSR
jgi:hypothetical protein